MKNEDNKKSEGRTDSLQSSSGERRTGRGMEVWSMGMRDDTRRSYPEARSGNRVHISRRPSRDEKWEVGDRDLGSGEV